jgi:hypothetical protein
MRFQCSGAVYISILPKPSVVLAAKKKKDLEYQVRVLMALGIENRT